MNKESMVYKMNYQGAQAGKQVYANLAKICEDPRAAQEALLQKILKDNANTEYGRKYHFDQIKNLEEYRKALPVITYDDIDEQVDRMKDGEKNVLTAYQFSHMNETSGTVGKKKLVPLTEEQKEVYMKYSNQISLGIIADALGEDWMYGRSFCTSQGTHTTASSGITIGCASSIMADACKGDLEPYSTMLKSMYTSPAEAMSPAPGTETSYIHTRFAMMDRDVTGITSGFISTLSSHFSYIYNHYQTIIDDIETGTIDASVQMPDEMRASLLKKLKPMPERAKELREIFKDGPDFPFAPAVWPHMVYYSCAGGDGFAVYDDNFEKQYMGGKVHRLFSGITASEGLWSVPVAMDNLSSVVVPDSAVLEFQPVENGSDFSDIKAIDELEVGKIYEFVITNLCGFYRYRMSDAVKVVGFWHNTPLVQFMYRVNKTINLACEKTTEFALRVTVENAAKRLGFNLIDYEVYPDTSAMPPRYQFLIEADDDLPSRVSKEELDRVIHEELCKANGEFEECYQANEIQAPDCYFEQAQTQLLYADKMVWQGASPSQLKPVHVISTEEQRKFFFGMRNLW